MKLAKVLNLDVDSLYMKSLENMKRLLPCIHEALIIPKDFCTESELKKIILKIREDNPNKSELLSDKVYLFDKAVKEIK